MKTAILYIATGKYIVFWKEFFNSCEKYFLTGIHKEYFVFTDATEFEHSNDPRVHTIEHKHLGWPFDTLMRFHVFSRVEDQLHSFDYVFFFNANMLFVQAVTASEFLPDESKDSGLVVTLHPGYFDQPVTNFPYEQEQKYSTAFIPKGSGKHYFMGGLNGGKTGPYLDLVLALKENTQADLDNNIIAKWHDESQLNKYMLDKNAKVLSPAYGYPEERKLPFEPKIIIRDKNKYGGHSFLRNEKRSLFQRVKFFLKKIKKKL